MKYIYYYYKKEKNTYHCAKMVDNYPHDKGEDRLAASVP